jgi:hypothetical protein
MSNSKILSIWKVSTLALCMGFAVGQGAAWAADDAAAPGVEVQKAHTIETKVYRIPKNVEESLGASGNSGIIELSYGMAGSFILPKPASI